MYDELDRFALAHLAGQVLQHLLQFLVVRRRDFLDNGPDLDIVVDIWHGLFKNLSQVVTDQHGVKRLGVPRPLDIAAGAWIRAGDQLLNRQACRVVALRENFRAAPVEEALNLRDWVESYNSKYIEGNLYIFPLTILLVEFSLLN